MLSDLRPASILVIGYGNRLRGDDGLGWLAAEQLMADGLPPHVQVLAVHQLTLELVEDLCVADRVVFLDARVGNSPGRIEHIALSADHNASAPFEHHMKPELLLAACKALYGYAPEAVLLTVQSTSFEMGSPLSAAIQYAWPEFIAMAKALAVMGEFAFHN